MVILVCFFLFGALSLVTVMVVNDIRNEEARKRVARRLHHDIQKVRVHDEDLPFKTDGIILTDTNCLVSLSCLFYALQVLDLYSPEGRGSVRNRTRTHIIDAVNASLKGLKTVMRTSTGSARSSYTGSTEGMELEPPETAYPETQWPAHAMPSNTRGNGTSIMGGGRMKYLINAARLMEEELEVHRTLDVHKIDRWLSSQVRRLRA